MTKENNMKNALIFEIKHFAVHDGPGIRTTVFFKGCPLSCIWCHNPEGISFKSELASFEHKCIGCGVCTYTCQNGAHSLNEKGHFLDRTKCTACGDCVNVCRGDVLKLYGKSVTVAEIVSEVLQDKDFYENSGGGVTLSGGECLMQADFCAELLKELKKEGIHTAVDTSGYVKREEIDKVMPYTDLFLYDIKAIDESVHIKCTGKSNKLILENLEYIDSLGKSIEIRYPYVPFFNSGEKGKIAEFVSSLKNVTEVKVLPYHNYAGSKYSALGMDCTLPETLPFDEEIKDAEKLFEKER